MFHEIIDTPVGPVLLVVDGAGALTKLYTNPEPRRIPADSIENRAKTAEAQRQIEEYFAGARRAFDLNLAPDGTEFQRRVWQALLEIPFGETRSYGQIAARIGLPQASRAVGRANGGNPISIVVPCHRVIGASGDLTGYGGGLPVKQWLLEFEGAILPARQASLAM